MDIFEYLPQLIVAYDGNDEFANLIHVKKADKDNDYYCPCCGGTVKPRALDSSKEQSHYYHITGKCTKESQLHFFCKNWLFEKGSKFYINNSLFEVASVAIEKTWNTQFGNYKPDITVYATSGEIIYFEMFFSNRKTGDDYFCKWDDLGNDVVEINIKEYMYKTDEDTIPTFTYLYHDGVCYSKTYEKRDLYANTIARIKQKLTRQKVLNYKARIEQLDWFWQEIRNNKSKEDILNVISNMEYEDMISCYEIIKRKQCVSYLKNDVLNMINQKLISDVRETLNLPSEDKDIYFDLERVHGRTYKAGIRLNLKTEHITYNQLHISHNHCSDFEKLKGFPKIVFSKNIFSMDELVVPENEIETLKNLYDYVVKFKAKLLNYEKDLSKFEKDKYKIKVKNDLHTVLVNADNDNFKVLLRDYYIMDFNIDMLIKEIDRKIDDKKNKEFLNHLFASNEYHSFLTKLKSYEGFDIRIDINQHTRYYQNEINFKLYISERKAYDKVLKREFSDFTTKASECEEIVQNFIKSYSIAINLVNKINKCKNNFWKTRFFFDYSGYPVIEIDQNFFIPRKYLTLKKIRFENFDLLSEQDIIEYLKIGMKEVLKNMEQCGYRVMEVCD